MEPQEKTASPHQRRRTTTSRPEEDHSRSRRSNGWAECREKNIGIEPMENTFFLTFLLIGHCYRPQTRCKRSPMEFLVWTGAVFERKPYCAARSRDAAGDSDACGRRAFRTLSFAANKCRGSNPRS